MKPVMPIGTEYFDALREGGYYFVDKTPFFSELFRSRPQVLLLTRPRRFGKSLLMSMTQQFLDIEDADKHRKLFEGLKVVDDPVAMKEFGTRPVVFLTMKNMEWDTWTGMQKKIGAQFAFLYSRFRSLLQEEMPVDDRAAFESIYANKASLETLSDAFVLLCRRIAAHYGRKAVLLIDEYDAPLQWAWSHGYYEDAIGFFRSLYSSALKSNPALDFAILTGVLRIAKESIFSGLNNLKVSTVMKGGFADACGYTKEDVQKLAQDLGCADKLEEIADWYDGYNFQGAEIYNPWSVNNYFSEHCTAEAYWVNTSGNSILQTMLERIDQRRARDLGRLMDGKTVRAELEDSFVYDDIAKNRANLYALLLSTGYLKCVGRTKDGDEKRYDLAIPNHELRSVFRKEIMKYLSYPYGSEMLYDMLEAMQEGEAEMFEESLQRTLLNLVSCHDAAHPESFYHGLMLGLTVWLERRYRIASNRESGYGRFDLAFFPKQALPGILMEFKAAADEEELEKKAEDALAQIEGKAYVTELEAAGVQTIWRYGIAFCKKHVVVKADEENA